MIGFTGGEIPTVKVNRLLLNNIDVVGVGWGAWAGTHPGALTAQWADLERLLASGRLAPPEPEVYPLDEAAQVALDTCRAHAAPPLEEVRFVLFSQDVLAAWLTVAKKL